VLTDSVSRVILWYMSTTEKLETVWFTTKGQVVIPLRLRKQFDIEDGTKAVVQATPEGILLKPMTAALIKRGRGILKRTPGGRPLTEDWADHRKQERALEGRHGG
jgi:AbrB family looped-hinge helix DNA binding protein